MERLKSAPSLQNRWKKIRMSFTKQLLLGLLLPAIVGGGILIFARSLSSNEGTIRNGKKYLGLSSWLIAAAFSVGYWKEIRMLFIKQLFLGLLLPAIVGGGILIFARSLSSNEGTIRNGKRHGGFSGWLIAAAFSVGYIVGYLGLEGLPSFPPRLGTHWLWYLAIIGLIVAGFWHFALWGRLIAQMAVSIIIPRLLLTSTFKYTWGQTEGIIWWVCLTVAIFIFWNLVQQSFTALPPGASGPFVYFGLSGGTALILALSGSLRLAQHGGILVALFAVSWIITLVLQRNSKLFVFPPGTSSVVTLLLAGIWMNGYFFAEVPAASAVLLAISPLLARVGHIETIQRLGARRSTLAQIAAIALPVIIAIGIAVIRSGFFGESSGY